MRTDTMRADGKTRAAGYPQRNLFSHIRHRQRQRQGQTIGRQEGGHVRIPAHARRTPAVH
jgi:hypothetical protein